VLEALKEEKSIAQAATKNGVHPNQTHHWKKQALMNFSQSFEGERKIRILTFVYLLSC
jgi:transposase-like protein